MMTLKSKHSTSGFRIDFSPSIGCDAGPVEPPYIPEGEGLRSPPPKPQRGGVYRAYRPYYYSLGGASAIYMAASLGGIRPRCHTDDITIGALTHAPPKRQHGGSTCEGHMPARTGHSSKHIPGHVGPRELWYSPMANHVGHVTGMRACDRHNRRGSPRRCLAPPKSRMGVPELNVV